jgi:transcriptional antiterminator RfaH
VRIWYVVNTLPHQEARAETNLSQQGYEVWLPRLLRSRRHARRIDTTAVPLFPGYLFVHLDSQTQVWRAINGTFGVRRILCHGDCPAPVEAGFVEALKKTTDESGVVALSAAGLKVGQPLRVLSGPFSDCVGTLLRLADKDRVTLLLSLLGREVQVLIARRQVMTVA